MLYRSLWMQTPGSCINSRWQWEGWLSSCGVKAEEKTLSLQQSIIPPLLSTQSRNNGARVSLLGSEVCVSLSLSVLAGFYPVNHTDCLQSYLHHCFDGITGELAHAFFPPTGEIHFDDHEYWILGNMRFSWKKGTCLYLSRCLTREVTGAPDADPDGSCGAERENNLRCLRCRGLADGSGPCGDSWNRPRPGTHALHGPESHNAPQCNSDGAEAHHTGWGVGHAPSLRYDLTLPPRTRIENFILLGFDICKYTRYPCQSPRELLEVVNEFTCLASKSFRDSSKSRSARLARR